MPAHYDTTYYDRFFATAYRLYRPLTNPLFLAFIGLLLLVIHSAGRSMGPDEGMWGYMARVWSENGIVPYSGTIDNKPPGILLLYYVSHSLFGTNVWFPRMVGILASFATSLCLYWIIRRLANHTAAIIGVVFYICLMPSKTFHAVSTAYTETFVIFFATLSFVLIIQSNDLKGWRHYLAIAASGFSIGSAIVFKHVALLDAVAMFILAGYFLKASGRGRSIAQAFGLMLLGILVANTVSLVALLVNGGSLPDYLRMAWIYLLEGRESEIGIIQRLANVMPAWSHNGLIIPYLGIVGFILTRKKLRQRRIPVAALLAWLGLDFIGVNAAGTYYQHQYKQILPPLCIVCGISFEFLAQQLGVMGQEQTFFKTKDKIVLGIILAILTCYVPFARNYSKGIQKIFRPEEDTNRQLASYIKQISATDDYIYIYQKYKDPILSYSDRLAPSQYFNTYFLSYPGAVQQVQRDMEEKAPLFILLEQSKNAPEWLREVVDKKYVKLEERDNFDIFVLQLRAHEIRNRIAHISSAP
ncbi:MAG: ArnT family glycosyltransferase [Planctomycetota bacterium]|jgi:hypothetical protein